MGVPLESKYTDVLIRDIMVARFESQLSGWTRNLLYIDGQLTLIISTIDNILIYHMSLMQCL